MYVSISHLQVFSSELEREDINILKKQTISPMIYPLTRYHLLIIDPSRNYVTTLEYIRRKQSVLIVSIFHCQRLHTIQVRFFTQFKVLVIIFNALHCLGAGTLCKPLPIKFYRKNQTSPLSRKQKLQGRIREHSQWRHFCNSILFRECH